MSVDTTMTDASTGAISVDTSTAEAGVAADTGVTLDSEATLDAEATPDGEANSEAETAPDAETEPVAETTLDTGTEVTFESLDLPAPLLAVLNEAGVVTAFPIQAATIPDALVGRDVLGRGRTGSGKTLAFGLPTLTRLEGLRAKPRRPLALVLVPTRELAMQVEDALRPYARALRLRIRSVYGGAPMRKQIDGLRYGVEILVATPGRLSDLIERGECELNEVDVAILDEADQMCDMGFLPHVCELMDQVAADGQRLLFSATLDGAVDEIVKKYMNDPVLHEVDPQAGVVSTMSHHLLMVTPQHKAKVAAQIAGRHAAEAGNADARSIFFVRTQMAVDRVTEQFRERGLPAAGLHGGMNQVARTKTLEDFKEGRTPVLIATDVAARGIHVDGIDLVVHLDPARESKDYLHRAGRTARAGQAGVVASLVLPKQRKQAQRLMDDAGVTAEELDAAPLGIGGRWESAGAALAQLTGAREVPEPGDVTPFTLPVRERVFRSNERRDGDRYGRDRYDRDDRRGGRFDGGRAHDGRSGGRSFGGSGFGGNGFSGGGSGSGGFSGNRSGGSGAGDSGSGENRGFRGSGFGGNGYARRDGDRDDRRGRSFDRRDGDQYGRDRDRDGRRGDAPSARDSAGSGSTGRTFEGRGFKDRDSSERSFGNRDGSAGRPFAGRDSERRDFGRGFEGRSSGGRDFKDRDGDGRGRFDRNDRSRGSDRPGYGASSNGEHRERSSRGEHFAHGDRPSHGERPWRDDRGSAGSRTRSDWNRGQQHTSRDDKPRS